MLIPKLNSALAYGGDYNPEQWPESVWQEDVKLMREAGVNLVTLGVFSWGKLQPTEKHYDFGWLDRAMDLLAANEIFVDLATATASPPPWMSHRYPDVLAIDANGATFYPGSRQHYSPCSPTYRRLAATLVGRLADRYKKHPALAAWHINNEYGNHVAECHGPDATIAFRTWLQRRYGTLEALNSAWGTAFWSQWYSTWNEILTPRRTPTFANPTQQLDYKRFMSDAVLELFVMERDIVRAATPDVPVTTNYMGFHKPMNYRKWSVEMDFVSWDNYPDPLPGRGGAAAGAAGHDLVRSLKKDRPFLLMEQSISSVTWHAANGPKPPGVMRLWSWQALARGSDGVLFFQWRASKAGAEKFLGGMVSHIPAEKSRTFADVKALGAELKKLAPISGSRVRAQVAIAFDWEAWWAVELDSKPAPIAYATWAQEIHARFYAQNIAVDFVHPAEELTGYRLVIAPALYLLSETAAANLARFVEGGGHLLATYLSGIVDENEHVIVGGYPARLRALLGLWVEEWLVLGQGETDTIRYGKRGQPVVCTHWRDAIHTEGAEVLATFSKGIMAGRPAITRHRFGRGVAYYLGTKPGKAALADLLGKIGRAAGVSAVLQAPPGVEATLREHADARFLFVLNHNTRAVRLSLRNYSGCDLITGKQVTLTVELAAHGAMVVELTLKRNVGGPMHKPP
jgi:beta-galactosidase